MNTIIMHVGNSSVAVIMLWGGGGGEGGGGGGSLIMCNKLHVHVYNSSLFSSYT